MDPNNGIEMPALGLGVFQSPPEETVGAVEAALATGYRLIDTAAAYGNEREVGEGIRRSGVDRGDVFVTTKLLDQGLRLRAGTAWHRGLPETPRRRLRRPLPPAPPGPERLRRHDRRAGKLKKGQARAIGVSNFSAQHLENLMREARVVPAVNQVELHPFFTQQSLRDFHRAHGITTQAWSPLGGVNVYRPADPNAIKNPLEHPTVVDVATNYGKTPAQIVLRWHIEHGTSAIPKWCGRPGSRRTSTSSTSR